MLMRIVALEKRAIDAERRMERLESILDAHFHANEPSFEEETAPAASEILRTREPVDLPFVHAMNEPPYWVEPTDCPLENAIPEPFWLEQHGVGWWRVFGPEGEITEKGLRRHEAQAMADQLNEQTVSRTA